MGIFFVIKHFFSRTLREESCICNHDIFYEKKRNNYDGKKFFM